MPESVAGDPLTERQAEVLDLYRQYMVTLGRPPSFREAMKDLGIASPEGVKCHLRLLVKKGKLTSFRSGGGSGRITYVPVVDDGCCAACGRKL